MNSWRRAARVLSLLGCLSMLLPGCNRKSDAERAAIERKELHDSFDSSLVLLPYRGTKTVLRAGAAQPPPAMLKELIQIQQSTSAALDKAPDDVVEQGRQLAVLLVGLTRAGLVLAKEDEDRYPLFWNVAMGATWPLPTPWYGNQSEHLLVAAFMLAFDVALRRGPILDCAFYEFERAAPQPSWPLDLQLFSDEARGVMYYLANKHYAAEEELAHYLGLAAQLQSTQGGATPLATRAHLGTLLGRTGPLRDDETAAVLLAIGHLSRAANRFALERDDAAYEDLGRGLEKLKALGIENELTDWAAITLATHHRDYAQAAQVLEHLAQSTNLSEEERAEVRTHAASLRTLDGKRVLFGRRQAQLVIFRALIARAGGVEKILATLVGPEQAAKLCHPMVYLDKVRTAAAGADTARVGRLSKEGLEKAKLLGGRGLDLVKGTLNTKDASEAQKTPAPLP